MPDTAPQVRSARETWAAPGSRHDRLVAVMRVALLEMLSKIAAEF